MRYFILPIAALLLVSCTPAGHQAASCCCKGQHTEMKMDGEKSCCCKGKKQCPMHQHQG